MGSNPVMGSEFFLSIIGLKKKVDSSVLLWCPLCEATPTIVLVNIKKGFISAQIDSSSHIPYVNLGSIQYVAIPTVP